MLQCNKIRSSSASFFAAFLNLSGGLGGQSLKPLTHLLR